jgi:hypothetical protein
MKKLVLSLTAVVFAACSFAQTTSTSTGKTGIGIRAGVNLSKFGGDAEGTKNHTGLNIGLDYAIPLGTSFAIQPEVAYSELGAKYDLAGMEAKEKLTYITVPILAKYTFATSGFSLYAGPQLGIMMSAKVKGLPGGTVDVKEEYNTTDFSGVFGLEFLIPNTGLFLSGRYQLGFSNINKDGNGKLNNNAATILVGYRF